jgi:uncharacterized protein YuzE
MPFIPEMKFDYYSDTDSLYIDLSERPSIESEEVAPGIILDFDQNGKVVGIDIEDASKIVDLSRLESNALPISAMRVAAVA